MPENLVPMRMVESSNCDGLHSMEHLGVMERCMEFGAADVGLRGVVYFEYSK